MTSLLSRRPAVVVGDLVAPKAGLRPDRERLMSTLDALASIGLRPDGSVCRRGFSHEDRQGRDQLSAWMKDAGMQVSIDAAGNLIGRLAGSDSSLPALVTGSHLDTVPTGGRFDGVLGVLAGLEVARTLQDSGEQLRHPFELVVFADEESTMVGCKAMVGDASPDPEAYATSNGESIERNLERIGGDWSSLASARRSDASIAAFLELHVEQGGILETRGDSIGVVEGIVGQRRFSIVVEGQANHAGTTPMEHRQDALVTASEVVLAIEAMALHHPNEPVATVGRLEVWPNAANVVPGSVKLTVDLRDLSPAVLQELVESLMLALENIGLKRGCRIDLDPQFDVAPTPADSTVIDAISSAASALGFSQSRLPSRASHDAQEVGRRWPMGMIFVPSQGGLSHSSAEFTSDDECWAGTAVLLGALQRLDQQL